MPDILNPEQKNRCWNDKKVEAHHAIIPTAKNTPVNLNQREWQIYHLIARQYLMQFCPDAEYRKSKITLNIAGAPLLRKRGIYKLRAGNNFWGKKTVMSSKNLYYLS